MIANPHKVGEVAVLVQTENVRRARFKSGNIPESDIVFQASPHIRACITGVGGRCDAFVGPHLEERCLVLGSVQRDLDFRAIAAQDTGSPTRKPDEVNGEMLRATSP